MTEQEQRLLSHCQRVNDGLNGRGFESWSPTAAKGYHSINERKRVESLVRQGFMSKTPHGYEITDEGRKALKEKEST